MRFENSVRGKVADYGKMTFAEMSRLIKDTNAVDMARAFANFNSDEKLNSLIKKHVDEGRNNYISTNGHKGLREQIVNMYHDMYDIEYDSSTEVTITAGASQAIYTILSALVHENDEVIIFEPSYDLYAPAVQINGGNPIFVQLQDSDYHIDWEQVRMLISPNTRFIILNSPNSPTGAILKAHDLEQLQHVVNGTDIIILSDESLQHLVYDGFEHQSICKNKELAKRSFVVSGFGKPFQITGWRVGFCLAPENLMHEFRKLHQYIGFNINTPAQFALAEYLETGVDFKQISKSFQKKRDLFCNLISNSRFTIHNIKSGIYQLLSYENISELKEVEMTTHLVKDFGVAGVPLSAFSHDKTDYGILRFCFARPDDVIQKAASILNKV